MTEVQISTPHLLAQAKPDFQQPDTEPEKASQHFYFKSAIWSPDGTCVISNGADNHIRNYVIPPDLLEPRREQLILDPFCSITSFESVNALTCYPGYDLQSPGTTLVLSAAREHPIKLNSSLTGELVSSYPLVSPTTEAYIVPHSLHFTSDGQKFIAGSESLLSVFDLSRNGEGPLTSYKTGPKNAKSSWSNPAISLRGFVSALGLDQQYNVLAAGTLNRQVGLYDAGGEGECIGTFGVQGTEADKHTGGHGITQLRWSRCGRYLYIVERKSDGVMIYDIRGTGQLLSWVEGRKAKTNQRMQIDVVTGDDGEDQVFAGGSDGVVRIWRAPHLQQGAVSPSAQFELHGGKLTLRLHVCLHKMLILQILSTVSRCMRLLRYLLLPVGSASQTVWLVRPDNQRFVAA